MTFEVFRLPIEGRQLKQAWQILTGKDPFELKNKPMKDKLTRLFTELPSQAEYEFNAQIGCPDLWISAEIYRESKGSRVLSLRVDTTEFEVIRNQFSTVSIFKNDERLGEVTLHSEGGNYDPEGGRNKSYLTGDLKLNPDISDIRSLRFDWQTESYATRA